METITLSNGLRVACKSLTKEEYQTILRSTIGNPIEKYKTKFGLLVNRLSNNQIIVNEDNYYTLYEKIEDLDAVLSDASNRPEGEEILFEKKPFGSQFPEVTNQLTEDLMRILAIDDTSLNKDLLKVVDRRIISLPAPNDFRQTHFMHFIAIIGEVLRKEYKASWEMKVSADGSTWNPYMRIDGNQTDFFSYLYEDIYLDEQTDRAVLSEVYQTVEDIIHTNMR